MKEKKLTDLPNIGKNLAEKSILVGIKNEQELDNCSKGKEGFHKKGVCSKLKHIPELEIDFPHPTTKGTTVDGFLSVIART